MEKRDNYRIQAEGAKKWFLKYDQQRIIDKLKLQADDTYLYTRMLNLPYRIHRATGSIDRQKNGQWEDANTFGEIMTLLDLVCDSREDRHLACRWKNMQDFSLAFHRNLLEDARDPWATRFDADPEGLRQACLALNGTPIPQGDVAYSIELFDGLCICVQLWCSDEEFPPQLRFLWDANALMYIKYETMHFAKGMLLQRLVQEMEP